MKEPKSHSQLEMGLDPEEHYFMSKHITLKVDTLKMNFTPYALAMMSNGLFRVIESYKENDTPILKYFLYCASIELGLKSSILSIDNSKAVKYQLKKKVCHDLIEANNLFLKKNPSQVILDSNDLISLAKINPFFKNKGLEYINTDVIVELMKGLSNFPDLEEIRSIAAKINKFLLMKKLYINL